MNNTKINIVLIIGVMLFSILTVFQQGKHYKYDYKLQSLQKELKSIENENQDIWVRYNMKYDLEAVSEYATGTLNMAFPKEVVTIYE